MTRNGIFVVVTLAAILIVAVIGSAYLWMGLDDTQISGHGYFALILGVIFTVGLGAGLMFLVFYSHRRGYDDRIGDGEDQSERKDPP